MYPSLCILEFLQIPLGKSIEGTSGDETSSIIEQTLASSTSLLLHVPVYVTDITWTKFLTIFVEGVTKFC